MDYEALLEGFYRSLLRSGDVAVDVGAHTGRHALPMWSAVAPSGRVHAFEPLPVAREALVRRIASEPGAADAVTVYPFALADHEGREEFVHAVDLPAYSGLRERIYDAPTRIQRIAVEVRTLDGMFASAPRVDYLKLDAEGGEIGILRGAGRTLARLAPVVTFEFGANSLGKYGLTVRDMALFWAQHPYRLFDILGRPLGQDAFITSAERQEVWDYVALPAGRADAILANWQRTA